MLYIHIVIVNAFCFILKMMKMLEMRINVYFHSAVRTLLWLDTSISIRGCLFTDNIIKVDSKQKFIADVYCKFGNFREGFIFAKLRIYAKFREHKILAKCRNHSQTAFYLYT